VRSVGVDCRAPFLSVEPAPTVVGEVPVGVRLSDLLALVWCQVGGDSDALVLQLFSLAQDCHFVRRMHRLGNKWSILAFSHLPMRCARTMSRVSPIH